MRPTELIHQSNFINFFLLSKCNIRTWHILFSFRVAQSTHTAIFCYFCLPHVNFVTYIFLFDKFTQTFGIELSIFSSITLNEEWIQFGRWFYLGKSWLIRENDKAGLRGDAGVCDLHTVLTFLCEFREEEALKNLTFLRHHLWMRPSRLWLSGLSTMW